jgi:hypothetical protein
MALFDNNPLQSLYAPIKSGIGGLFEGMTPFGSSIPSGILDPKQEEKLRNQALFQGLLGTAATYLATPKNLNTGSPLPYIGKAVLGGMGASQDAIDRAIRAKLLSGRDSEFSNINPLDVTPESLKAYQDSIAQGKPDRSLLRRAAPVERQELPADLKLLQQYNTLDPNSPTYESDKKYITDLMAKARVKPEGLNINLGQPVAVINPKTGKTELVQFPNKPGEKPIFTGLEKPEPELKLKPVPAGPATAFSENNTAIKKIDDAIAKVEAAPDNTFGVKNYLGGAITQRIDPKGTAARAAVAGVGGQKYHDLSGAAVAIQEAARLSPYIPQVTDTKQKVLENLNNLKQEYTYTNDTLTSTFNEDQGYRPLNVKAATQTQQQTTEPKQSQSVPNAPKVGQVMNGYKFKGGNPADKNNWEKM